MPLLACNDTVTEREAGGGEGRGIILSRRSGEYARRRADAKVTFVSLHCAPRLLWYRNYTPRRREISVKAERDINLRHK